MSKSTSESMSTAHVIRVPCSGCISIRIACWRVAVCVEAGIQRSMTSAPDDVPIIGNTSCQMSEPSNAPAPYGCNGEEVKGVSIGVD